MNVAEVIKNKAIPKVLHGSLTLTALWRVVLSPIQHVSDRFDTYVLQKKTELKYNGQVMYLERALNDYYDATQRRIFIDDAAVSAINPVVLYRKNESQPSAILYRKSEPPPSVVLYRNAEIPTIDFTVFVPAAVLNAVGQIKIKAVVNLYRIAAKTYTIETF